MLKSLDVSEKTPIDFSGDRISPASQYSHSLPPLDFFLAKWPFTFSALKKHLNESAPSQPLPSCNQRSALF